MQKIIVAVTGASGSIYAKLLLKKFDQLSDQIKAGALVVSQKGEEVWHYELNENIEVPQAFKRYAENDFFSPIASGSAGYKTMIICPCSMGTLGRIASGVSSDLISRAADVILKERGKLIIVPRETPYNLIHINNMKTLTEAGAIICPASPSFYSIPKNIEELAQTVVDRILTLAGFEISSYKWSE